VNLCRGIAALVVALIASPVLADVVLPIGGAFGNEAGCAFFMTGAYGTDDDMIVVTPDTLTSYLTGCYFESMIGLREDGAYDVAAACHAEGEDGTFDDVVTVTNRGGDGLFVALQSGAEWGPLFKCEGTESLFKPPGTRV
jgi:hypothetical protein